MSVVLSRVASRLSSIDWPNLAEIVSENCAMMAFILVKNSAAVSGGTAGA
jgi:hypothetical protein